MVKVDITTAGHTIIVESDKDDLETVAAKALDLYRETRDPKLDRAYATTGFHAERSDPDYGTDHDGVVRA
ncbi:MAG TPA: hypothetical protein VHJ83_16560 [Micromonosporaceae bacterium]|nr:hypothetical protein [Micromonosporaceae bacterium]